jgi:transposase
VEAEDAEPAPETAKLVPAKPRRRAGRAVLPPELPRIELIHELSEDERQCAEDGTQLAVIGQETSEQLDVIPARVRVIRHVRLKYACKTCEEGVAQAPMPPQPLPKSNASPALLATVATAKYADGLPLYRQQRQFSRMGVELSRNTLARWMLGAGELTEPLVEQLRAHLRQGPLIHMDETTVQVNTEPGRKASSPSYMWVSRGGPTKEQVVLFDYDPSRGAAVPGRLLEGFAGVLLTDGYEGYARPVREYGLTHAGCWAHARRKFVEAQKLQPKGKSGRADKALSLIAKLYQVEKEARVLGDDPRLALRQECSRPVIDQLRAWLDRSLAQVPPKGAIGRALHYLSGQWHKLTRFLDDGRIPLDNNPAENAIRPFVIGRKNWLFSHTPKGAQASAALYSLIETAKANGLEPYAYLLEVFTRLPAAKTEQDLHALLPWRQEQSLAVRFDDL